MHSFMKTIDSVQKFNHKLSKAMEAIGVLALLVTMAITFTDVIGAKVFLMPVPGSIDIVMMAQIAAISFGAMSTLIASGHVSVEFFLMKMPIPIKKLTIFFIEMLCLILFLLICWRLAIYGYQVYHEGEVSPTAHIPLYPFAFGITLAMIPLCIEFCVKILKLFFDKPVRV